MKRFDLNEIKFDKQSLVPIIVQDDNTSQVLMMAWMNGESLRKTLETRNMVYWSRSRQTLWRKGETSGNTQRLVTLSVDCDKDCLLARVDQTGAACHTNNTSCFFTDINLR